MAGSHPSGEVLGAKGRSGRLYADGLFGSVTPGAAVSPADTTFASVWIGVEVDLADRRCAPTVVRRLKFVNKYIITRKVYSIALSMPGSLVGEI